MTESSAGRAEAIRLQKLASKKRYDELEAAWAEAVEKDAVPPDDLLFVLESVARSGDAELTDSLLWFLLTERTEQKGAADVLGVARSAVPLFPGSTVLREETTSLYRAAHADLPEVEVLTELTLKDAALPLPAAVEQMEHCLALQPGAYVLDRAREETGQVDRFDGDAHTFEVSFESGPRSYCVADAAGLERLDSDDFRALSLFDPEKLTAMAHEDPAELVTHTLRAFGPKLTFKGLRARLAGVIPDADWAEWWKAARPRLRRAAWVDMTDRAQPTFALRKTAIPYDAILKAQFHGAETAEEKLVAVLDYLNEIDGGAPPNNEMLGFFGTHLDRLVETVKDAAPAAAIGCLALAAELHQRAPDAAPQPNHSAAELLPEDADFAGLMRPIRHDRLGRLIVALVRDALPERWAEVYAAALPGCPAAACEAMASELCAAGLGDRLRDVVPVILAKPDQNARALGWLWRTTASGGCPQALADVDRVAVALGLFSAAQLLGRGKSRARPDQHPLLQQVRQAISLRDFAILHEVLEQAGEGRAKRVNTLVERHTGLSDSACRRVHEILRKTHPELFVEHVPPWQEDVVYTTQAGLTKRQEELGRLVTEKLAGASKAVGAAAALGDLSENAEWTAACEMRDRLAGQATRMQEETQKAKLITHEMAESDTVSVGSRVRTRDPATDHVESMTFLGPWDADHDQGIYSYRAAVGIAFMGKAVGDRVVLDAHGERREWEILEIGPGL